MSSVSSIEPVGILNAWTTKVVPKIASTTVTISDSKVSRKDDFWKVSAICLHFICEHRQGALGGLLLGSLLAGAAAPGHHAGFGFHFYGKGLLVLKSLLLNDAVAGRPLALGLEAFLQRALVIARKQIVNTGYEVRREDHPLNHSPGFFKTPIAIDGSQQRFKRIHEDAGFASAAAPFLRLAQP